MLTVAVNEALIMCLQNKYVVKNDILQFCTKNKPKFIIQIFVLKKLCGNVPYFFKLSKKLFRDVLIFLIFDNENSTYF